MSHDEWRKHCYDIRQQVAESMGYSLYSEMPASDKVYIEHRLAEIWIEYKSPYLQLPKQNITDV